MAGDSIIDPGPAAGGDNRTLESCSHCGLPFRAPSARSGGFCCSGCAIAATLLAGASGSPAHSRKGLVRFGLAAFFGADVMALSLFLYSGEPAPPVVFAAARLLLLCLSAPIFLLLAPPYLAGMRRDLRRARLSMDTLISVGAGAAFAYSCASVIRGSGEVYFDTAAMVLLLVAAGRLVEAYARVRGRRGLRDLLRALAPKARIARGGSWIEAGSREVTLGELVRVLPGERIPVDGRVAAGSASVDASPITGEAAPASKGPGDEVLAGSLCLDGMLDVTCAALHRESLLARIAAAVEQAQAAPSQSERIADRMAAVLTPATLALAAVAVAIHWREGFAHAALTGLSVLVVACPCALGIAIPLVYVLALTAAARRGILIRSAEALERLAAVDSVVFDKTGTLTSGEIAVARVMPCDGWTEDQVIAAAAAAAAYSAHPVARAIRGADRLVRGGPPGSPLAANDGFSGSRADPGGRPTEVSEFPGRGLRVNTGDSRTILLGQPRWVAAETGAPKTPVAGEGSVSCAVDGKIIGALVLRDRPAPGIADAIAECRSLGLHISVLSGDGEEAVRELADGIGVAEARGGLLPEEKARRVREMRDSGRRVVVVADGLNDAPALASADVGVAVAHGAEVAREAAEVALLAGGAVRVPELVRAARATRRAARFNVPGALVYNAAALSLAVAGMLRPLWAATLMLLSSIFVVIRAIRIPSYVFPPISLRHSDNYPK